VVRTVSFVVDLKDAPTVTPHIDGVSLATLVEAFEEANGYADPAGGYGGLIPDFFRGYGPLDDYFTGNNPPANFLNLKGIYLLGCSCGEVGCWPLIASVRVVADTFEWAGFRQPYRPQRDYSAFGPFVFARRQYEGAVNEMANRLNNRV
jgi:hypothetical protein